MNKLDMAMQIILAEVRRVGICSIDEDKVKETWFLVDAIQAEADKREREQAIKSAEFSKQMMYALTNERPETTSNVGITDTSTDDWQPDWSAAPNNMNYFFMNRNGSKYWAVNEPDKPNFTEHVINFRDCSGDCYKSASSQNYQGDWKQSLRKRPETKPIEEKPKQHQCNCAHWKGSSFFMGDTFTCNDCGGTVTI